MQVQLFRRPPRLLFEPALLLDLAALLIVSTLLLSDQVTKPKQSVLQITLPPPPYKLHDAEEWAVFPKPADIRRMRHWQTVWLTGDNQADSLNLRLLWRKLAHLQQFPNNTTGVAVRFTTGARFGRIVDAVDCVNQWDVKKYYLDIYTPATVLYAFTDARQHPISAPSTNYDPVSATTSVVPDSSISAPVRWLHHVGAPLHHPAWGTALLACLGLAAVGAAAYLVRELS
jgi:hypothetical protein